MAGSWLLLLAFRVSSCIVATSGWASSEAFLVSRSQPFAFFSSFPFPDVVVFSGVWVCCWPVRLAAPQAWHSCLHCAEFFY